MKNKVFFFILCIVHSVQAYICSSVIMRKFLPELDRYHYVIGLGDFHDAVVLEDLAHRAAVDAWLKQPSNKGMRVITEDLYVPNVEGRFGMKGFHLLPRSGAFLGGITDVVRVAGAVGVNLEYRYGRLLVFGPLRHAANKLSAVATAQKITVHDLIGEVEHELDAIARFSDGQALNAWYAGEVTKIRSAMQSLQWYAHADKTVAGYVATLHVPLRAYIDEHLLIFDKTILDMKIMHDIVTSSNAQRTCIIAGASHIDRAEVQLKRVGYEVVVRIDPEWGDESIAHPCPIKLSELNSFLN